MTTTTSDIRAVCSYCMLCDITDALYDDWAHVGTALTATFAAATLLFSSEMMTGLDDGFTQLRLQASLPMSTNCRTRGLIQRL